MTPPTTPLRSALVRLKSPLTAGFDADAWRVLIGAAGKPSDYRLLRSAEWLASQAKALRDADAKGTVNMIGGRLSAILALASMNHTMIAILGQERASLAKGDDALAFDHIVGRPNIQTMTGEMASSDDVIEILVGAAESWLYDAYHVPAEGEPSEFPTEELARAASLVYSAQRSHSDLWSQARWEGWGLDETGSRWCPGDPDAAVLQEAWKARVHGNAMNLPWLIITEWKDYPEQTRRALSLKRTVELVEKTHRGPKIKLGRRSVLSARKVPLYALDRAMLDGSYLASLADEPLPKAPDLNVGLLLQAWHLLYELANRMMAGLEGEALQDRVDDFALLIGRPALAAMLEAGLSIPATVAEQLIGFLTYTPNTPNGRGQRGLWAAPLVSVPGTDLFGLAVPTLISSYALRKFEAWLERGGLDDQLGKKARGESLEREYRTRLSESVEHNQDLQTAVVAPKTIKKGKGFGEQIDLLFRIGSLLVVAEVKHRLFPAESLERFNYFENLKGAADQANRKAAAIEGRREVAAAALSLPLAEVECLRVVPLIVVNQGFGLGLLVDGVRVTETSFLKTLLGARSIITGMSVNPVTNERVFTSEDLYRDEADLVARFEAILENPSVLRRFVERIEWRTFEFPKASGGSITIEAPTLADISGEERRRVELVKKLFRSQSLSGRPQSGWS